MNFEDGKLLFAARQAGGQKVFAARSHSRHRFFLTARLTPSASEHGPHDSQRPAVRRPCNVRHQNVVGVAAQPHRLLVGSRRRRPSQWPELLRHLNFCLLCRPQPQSGSPPLDHLCIS